MRKISILAALATGALATPLGLNYYKTIPVELAVVGSGSAPCYVSYLSSQFSLDCDTEKETLFTITSKDGTSYTLASGTTPLSVTDGAGQVYDTFTLQETSGSFRLLSNLETQTCVMAQDNKLTIGDCSMITDDQLFNFYIPRSKIDDVEITYYFKEAKVSKSQTKEIDRRIFYNPNKSIVSIDKEVDDKYITETFKFQLKQQVTLAMEPKSLPDLQKNGTFETEKSEDDDMFQLDREYLITDDHDIEYK